MSSWSSRALCCLGPGCYGAGGSLHVGLVVNISALLYMVCCRCQTITVLVFFFPPLYRQRDCTVKSSLIGCTCRFTNSAAWYGYGFNLVLLSRCLTGFPHDNLLSKSLCRKCSASTKLKTESRSGVAKKWHTPGARASKSKQQECDWNEWECKPCQSSDLNAFF